MTGSLVSPATRDRVRGIAIPFAAFLGRLGLTPNGLTVIGFIGTCFAALAAGSGWWLASAILVLAFGIFDLFDGTLARVSGRVSRFGAFLDSTLDRAGEAIVYIGIAFGCLQAQFAFGALLAATAMGTAFMVSYTRAKSESLGFTPGTGMANVGLAPREVRIVILVAGLILAGLAGDFLPNSFCMPDPFFPDVSNCVFAFTPTLYFTGSEFIGSALGLITILAGITTIQRMVHVRAQARED
jgi:phosphatidylglycerophosphate synthase